MQVKDLKAMSRRGTLQTYIAMLSDEDKAIVMERLDEVIASKDLDELLVLEQKDIPDVKPTEEWLLGVN
jgi:hypothetical protein